jgi:CelD/BcsL family acetyltransferase involved in cellulose biosynthesis
MPFRSWDWLTGWWKHYGDTRSDGGIERGRQLYVLAVYESPPPADSDTRALIGIVPWYLERSAVKGNVLKWLGSGEVCTDHLSVLCQPANTERVVQAIAESLRAYDDWDRLQLDAVDSDDIAIERLVTVLEHSGSEVTREPADACWALELPTTWDDYLASISKSHRKQLRQLERRVLESDRVQWHCVQKSDELPAAWDVLVDLHQRRRSSLGEPGCFASDQFHAFHRDVAERMLARNALRISWLALDGVPAAAEYHFADRTATYAYQGGVDPDRLDEEPGRLSTILCLKQAIEEGHQRLDFLRGDEPYKAHWRATPRATVNYAVVPNRRMARLRGRVLNLADTLGDWARQGANLVTSPAAST